MRTCDTEVIRDGKTVAVIINHTAARIEDLIMRVAADTRTRTDWFYFSGRAVVRTLGPVEARQLVRAAIQPHASDSLMIVEEDGTWTTRA